MKTPSSKWLTGRRTLSSALFVTAFGFIGFALTETSSSQATREGKREVAARVTAEKKVSSEPADLAAFRQAVGGSITPLIVELKGEPGVLRKVAADKAGQPMSIEQTISHAQGLMGQQDAVLTSLAQRGASSLAKD